VDHLLRCQHCSQKRSLHSSRILHTPVPLSARLVCYKNPSYIDHYLTIVIYLYLPCLYFLLFTGKNHTRGEILVTLYYCQRPFQRLDNLYFLYFTSFPLINPVSTTIPDSHSLVTYECVLLTLLSEC